MNISRDVVKDLIAVYLAGDASADTRALVESYLKTDPELAGDVRRHAARAWDCPRRARRLRRSRRSTQPGNCSRTERRRWWSR